MTSAPIASTPEPHPKSTTSSVFPRLAKVCFSQRRHNRVVGCSPVPNAMPGSSAMFTAFASTSLHQSGTMYSPSAIFVGVKLSFTACTQSFDFDSAYDASNEIPKISSAASIPARARA